MTEAILIEIAQRRRKLEDAWEESELHLIARQERLKERMAALEARYMEEKLTYDAWCRLASGQQNEFDGIAESRDKMEKFLELCRDDCNRMADVIRGAAK